MVATGERISEQENTYITFHNGRFVTYRQRLHRRPVEHFIVRQLTTKTVY